MSPAQQEQPVGLVPRQILGPVLSLPFRPVLVPPGLVELPVLVPPERQVQLARSALPVSLHQELMERLAEQEQRAA